MAITEAELLGKIGKLGTGEGVGAGFGTGEGVGVGFGVGVGSGVGVVGDGVGVGEGNGLGVAELLGLDPPKRRLPARRLTLSRESSSCSASLVCNCLGLEVESRKSPYTLPSRQKELNAMIFIRERIGACGLHRT